MQLVAGELDGEHVIGTGRLQHHVHQRHPDVADGRGAQPLGLQDGGQHPYGRGLAVGAGDREPRRGVRAAHPPGQLHVAPHGDAGRLGGLEERAGGLPPGGGDDEVGALGKSVAVAEADGDAQLLQRRGLRPLPLAVTAVDDGDDGAEAGQGAGGGNAAHAETGHGHVLSGEVEAGHLAACQPP